MTAWMGSKALGLLWPPGNAAWKTQHQHSPERYNFHLVPKIQK